MKLRIAVAALSFIPACAYAAWETIEQPMPMSDLENATMINTENMDRSIVVECEQGALSISYTEYDPKEDGEHIDTHEIFPMQLKVGNDKLDLSKVNIERRNSEYIAFKAVDHLETRRALYMLYNAKGPITMEVKEGNQISGTTLSSTGSNKAAEKIAKACNINFAQVK